jgi:dihydrodipicolinate synthase/N-acetylneuraminate lyase
MNPAPAAEPPLELYAIAPTPFNANLTVDGRALAAHVERLAATGIRRFLLTGSYGEFQSLTDDERVDVLRGVRATGAADSIMACAALPSTGTTAALALRMLDAGADLVMVSAPLACELTESDILRHFESLSETVRGGLVVYNTPVFGVDLGPSVLGAVAAMDGYVAVKQGTRDIGNLLRGLEAVRAAGRGVRVLAAADLMAAATLAVGLDGLTSTNSWVFPDVFQRMIRAAGDHDMVTLARLDGALLEYRAAAARFGQPATVKAAMHVRGYEGTPAVRRPYAALCGDAMADVVAAVEACDSRLAGIGTPVGAFS